MNSTTTNTVLITGNTYPVKDRLKSMGGRWDAVAALCTGLATWKWNAENARRRAAPYGVGADAGLNHAIAVNAAVDLERSKS